MALNTTPPPRPVDDFITGAPDAAHAAKGFTVGRQAQISLAMPPELLAAVDEAARAMNVSRASYIKILLTNATRKT